MSSKHWLICLLKKLQAEETCFLILARRPMDRIPVIQQQRLLDIGGWLDINGEAIYGTRKWEGAKKIKLKMYFFTKKGNDLYVLCTKFPEKPIVVKWNTANQAK